MRLMNESKKWVEKRRSSELMFGVLDKLFLGVKTNKQTKKKPTKNKSIINEKAINPVACCVVSLY